MGDFRIPKQIVLHGKKAKTTLVKSVDDDDNLGEYDQDKRLIRLKEGQTNTELAWAFWHEAFHFFLHVNGVARDDVGIPGMAEEMLCDSFADFMTQNFNVTVKRGKK